MGNGDRYIGSLFRVDEPVPDDSDALRIYFNLCIIKYFLDIISPLNDMKAKIDALLSSYPSIDINAMGFPRGWENEPLWQ